MGLAGAPVGAARDHLATVHDRGRSGAEVRSGERRAPRSAGAAQADAPVQTPCSSEPGLPVLRCLNLRTGCSRSRRIPTRAPTTPAPARGDCDRERKAALERIRSLEALVESYQRQRDMERTARELWGDP